VISGISESPLEQPKTYQLFQNYPNPFNPSTEIQFQLASPEKVSLKIYDVLGKQIVTLVDETRPAGVFTVHVDASRLSSGIYFYTMKAGSYQAIKKMILLK
jgi:hypothetical protein